MQVAAEFLKVELEESCFKLRLPDRSVWQRCVYYDDAKEPREELGNEKQWAWLQPVL